MLQSQLPPGLRRGVIMGVSAGRCFVLAGQQTVVCVISGRFRRLEPEPLAVGDEVSFDLHGDQGVIHERSPRRTVLARRAAGKAHQRQLIAANVDRLVITLSADAPLRPGLVDRYLVIAESAGIRPILCLTKTDLAANPPSGVAVYERLGYEFIRTSAACGRGLTEFAAAMEGLTAVLVGHSGTGKTSLLNAVSAGSDGAVGGVNRHTGKGRHTTSGSRLVPLPGGGRLIDTPGVRELGLWAISPEDLRAGFVEFAEVAGGCRFGGGCTHHREPGCAVREAASAGRVDPVRYRSYLKLLTGDSAGPEGSMSHSAADERRPAVEESASPAAGFVCVRCGQTIAANAPGTDHRNHCPHCLWSVHLDVNPGDRAAGCGGGMEPIAVWVRPRGEWTILHRCTACNAIRPNRIAGDDSELLLMSMAVRPLANPPFPLDRLAVTPVVASGPSA